MDLSLSSLSLVTALSICAYLTYLCSKPPNPNSPTTTVPDRIALATDLSPLTKPLLITICTFHSLLILFPSPSSRSTICLNPHRLNDALFAWSPTSITFITITLIAAPLRLLAYAQLGKNFTFKLEKPSQLIKDGIYAYVQHPSYTTLMMVNAAGAFFWCRLDGIAGCLLPKWILGMRWGNVALGCCITGVHAIGLWVRVRDEEGMLKKEFGREWEEYHRKTKRFIPGVI